MRRRRTKARDRLVRGTADQRAKWARERKALVGKIITQKGLEGALIIEHIRGSQYLLRLANGEEVFASHKKGIEFRSIKEQARSSSNTQPIVSAGWKLWEERR